MGRLSEAYRQRANRARRIPRRVFLQEARIVKSVATEAVNVELYQRQTTPTTGRMRRSIMLRYFPGGFAVVFAGEIAPYAGVRVNRKGVSKTDGHRLDMNPGRYIKRKAWPTLWALRRKGLQEVGGGGVTSINVI